MGCKLNIMNQQQIHFDAPFYAIELPEKYSDEADAKRSLYRYYRKLMRIKHDSKYDGISFGIGISNCDGKAAQRTVVRNGKRGRPRILVQNGKSKDWHIHCVVYGNHASSFCQEFIDYYRKKNSAPIRKKNLAVAGRKGAEYVPYCYNQCIKWLTHGSFDFSKLYNVLVWKEADRHIISHKSSEYSTEKVPNPRGIWISRRLYVINRVLGILKHFQDSDLAIRKLEQKPRRAFLRKTRLHCYDHKYLSRRVVALWLRTILYPRNEDCRWHTAKPLPSIRSSNDHSLRRVHHISAATLCQSV